MPASSPIGRREVGARLGPLGLASLLSSHTLPPARAGADLVLPPIGLGTCCDDAPTALHLVSLGLQAGYRLIDTAGHYDSEPAVGAAIDKAVEHGILRDKGEVTVCTKIWFTEMGYDKTIAAARRSLENLRSDQIDLLLVHFPGSPDSVQDPKRNRELRASTWRALETLRDDGLVRSIGVSNWSRRHLRETLATCRIHPSVMQTEVHPRHQQEELREDCRAAGIKVMAHCPLAHGSPLLLGDPTLMRIANNYGKSPAQIALRWSLQKGVIPLPHGSSKTRITENLGALSFELSASSMASIDGLEVGDRAAFNPSLIA
eukprot:scaffold273433_cov28-Tisochrysis_lutea.AAC.1